jgi:hypothetical protein
MGLILDTREDWQDAAAATWASAAKQERFLLPCRITSEFLVRAFEWYRSDESRAKAQEAKARTESGRGWNKTRAMIVLEPNGTLRHHAQFPGILVEPQDAKGVSKAVKADAAEADTSLWNIGGDSEQASQARAVLQRLLHKAWYQGLEAETQAWLEAARRDPTASAEEVERSEKAISDCLRRARNSTWFEWDDGSRLFWWRWPEEFRMEARDGSEAYMFKVPAKTRREPRKPDMEKWMSDLQDDKLRKFLRRRYMNPCDRKMIHVLMVIFSVLKGETDVRPVYSLTEVHVNECFDPPRMFLPT